MVIRDIKSKNKIAANCNDLFWTVLENISEFSPVYPFS